MKALVGAFNQEKALVGAFFVIMNLRMDLFQALLSTAPRRGGILISLHTVSVSDVFLFGFFAGDRGA